MRAHVQGRVLHGTNDKMQRGYEAVMRNRGKVLHINYRILFNWQGDRLTTIQFQFYFHFNIFFEGKSAKRFNSVDARRSRRRSAPRRSRKSAR